MSLLTGVYSIEFLYMYIVSVDVISEFNKYENANNKDFMTFIFKDGVNINNKMVIIKIIINVKKRAHKFRFISYEFFSPSITNIDSRYVLKQAKWALKWLLRRKLRIMKRKRLSHDLKYM